MSTKNSEITPLNQGGLKENRIEHSQDSIKGEWDAIDAACRDADRISAKLPPNHRDTLLPDGMVIRAYFQRAEALKHLQRWVAHFVIAEEPEMEEFSGLPVIRCWNVPQSGKRISPNHHLYQDYKAVTGLRGLVIAGNHGPSAVLGSFLRDVQIEAVTQCRDSLDESPHRPMGGHRRR